MTRLTGDPGGAGSVDMPVHSTDDAALPPMRLRQVRPAPMPADVQWNGQPLQAFDWRWNAGTRVLRAERAGRRGHLRVRRMCG
jgi:hypothetical protein